MHIETASQSQGKSQNVYYQAQDILSRRDHSEYEVRSKLKRKGFSQEQIENAVAWLIDNNLIDDRRFARAYAEQILSRKPVGPKWIKVKLRQRGIDAGIAAGAITSAFEAASEPDLALTAARHWIRQHPKPQTDDLAAIAKHKDKLVRHLTARGFSYEAMQTALDSSQLD